MIDARPTDDGVAHVLELVRMELEPLAARLSQGRSEEWRVTVSQTRRQPDPKFGGWGTVDITGRPTRPGDRSISCVLDVWPSGEPGIVKVSASTESYLDEDEMPGGYFEVGEGLVATANAASSLIQWIPALAEHLESMLAEYDAGSRNRLR